MKVVSYDVSIIKTKFSSSCFIQSIIQKCTVVFHCKICRINKRFDRQSRESFIENLLWILGTGELKFDDFCKVASHFLEEDTESEAVQQELREAFRLYDKEGNGYITTDVFRDILHELDDALSPEELDMIIEEVDIDGSGTLDFEGERSCGAHRC